MCRYRLSFFAVTYKAALPIGRHFSKIVPSFMSNGKRRFVFFGQSNQKESKSAMHIQKESKSAMHIPDRCLHCHKFLTAFFNRWSLFL